MTQMTQMDTDRIFLWVCPKSFKQKTAGIVFFIILGDKKNIYVFKHCFSLAAY